MKHVSLLIPKGHFSLVNIEGTHQILNWVNFYLEEQGKPPLFRVQLIGIDDKTTQTSGLYTIYPELLFAEVKHTDLIIIPAIHGSMEIVLEQNKDMLPWIVRQYQAGAEIASLCLGTFFLAATGLLDGKPCATHWAFANEFRRQFPRADLLDEKIITDAQGIYTSGGAYSFTNLLLYLIEKYAGREVAIRVSKAFMIDIDRNTQSPFIVFNGQKSHADSLVLKIQAHIEENFQDKILVNQLCDTFAISRRSLERRFKKVTSNTVVQYIQRVKIEAAKKQLETGHRHINDVMFNVGYNDSKAFRDVFKKTTGMTPVAYRDKYNVDLALVS